MIDRLRRLIRGRSTEAHRPGEPDPDAFMAALARSRIGANYTAFDRYRDFSTVFLDSDAGKRVLYQIFEWTHLYRSSYVPGDADATHVREGERAAGLKIFATLNGEPKEHAAIAQSESQAEA